jgi:hypothetical protein
MSVENLIDSSKKFFDEERLASVELEHPNCLFCSYDVEGKKTTIDPSVDFVGSNTNMPTIKDMILERNLPSGGTFTSGLKLRTWNSSHWQNEASDLKYSSVFNSFGLTFDSSYGIQNAIELIKYYLTQVLGVDTNKLVITGDNEVLLEVFGNTNLNTQKITGTNRFNWKFGVKNDDGTDRLTGTGIAIEFKNEDELSGDFGTFEIIYDNGKEVAMEFGFGFETFLARLESSHPIKFTPSWQTLEDSLNSTIETDPKLKIADSLNVALAVLRSYYIFESKGGGQVSINNHKKGKELLTKTSNAIRELNQICNLDLPKLLQNLRLQNTPESVFETYRKRFE